MNVKLVKLDLNHHKYLNLNIRQKIVCERFELGISLENLYFFVKLTNGLIRCEKNKE